MYRSRKSFKNIAIHMMIMAMVLFTQIFYDTVYAQTEEQEYNQEVKIVTNPALKLQLVLPTDQEYPSKSFDIVLTVDSLIDSNRVGVKWFYNERLLNIAEPERDIISVVKGQKTTLRKTFTPEVILPPSTVNRRVEIAVEVNGFVAGENYISSNKTELVFTPEMVITPTLESYTRAKTFYTIRVWGLWTGAVILLGLAIFFVIRQFREYLNHDEVV
ncbi:MAG TPA: hypothetical protein PKU78_02040 [Candidatus Dojkabacteria bacterium]|nr:hypothetical protein [Candidatus Dojkabacteria bacterium]HRO64977.1 hypothetical protein [Candidatus Dojkabacteria bacterium]HRP50695.1 hypothetical protein [Candidatus Dojkabacteria bacterium]